MCNSFLQQNRFQVNQGLQYKSHEIVKLLEESKGDFSIISEMGGSFF